MYVPWSSRGLQKKGCLLKCTSLAAIWSWSYIDGLVQDCSNPSALAILQSCTKLLISYMTVVIYFYSGLLISDFFVDYPSITSNKSRRIHQATFTQVGFAVHLSCDKVQRDMRDMLSDTGVLQHRRQLLHAPPTHFHVSVVSQISLFQRKLPPLACNKKVSVILLWGGAKACSNQPSVVIMHNHISIVLQVNGTESPVLCKCRLSSSPWTTYTQFMYIVMFMLVVVLAL